MESKQMKNMVIIIICITISVMIGIALASYLVVPFFTKNYTNRSMR